ncbi:MAG: helix-hairpin-helix domain-containing protein [Bacteroidota bacterium]|nr:helix-hairpin-helix domain-containing protein [Bacteroidota bacterium]
MKTKILITLLLFLSSNNILLSQIEEQTTPDNPEQVIENILENYVEKNDNADFSQITNDLLIILRNPININTATASELQSLFFLSSLEINNILKYVKYFGPVFTIYELQDIEGVTHTTLQNLQPFITFSETRKKTSSKKYLKQDLMIRTGRIIEQQKGYVKKESKSAFQGTPWQHYLRYTASYGKIQAGITAEKDPGEKFFKPPNKTRFDYYSGVIMAEKIGVLKKVIVGDYSLQFGQGLTFWSGMTFGKSFSQTSPKKYAPGLKPYHSAAEYGFMRGIASTIKFNKLEITTFFSKKAADGNIVFSEDSTGYHISSIQQTGYHRTENELEDQNSFKETILGSNISFNIKHFRIGTTFYLQKFDHEIIPSNTLSNKFKFHGKKNSAIGIDFAYNFPKGELYGELSHSKNGANALLIGSSLYLHSRCQLSMLYRNYSHNYQNIFSNAFAESSSNQNEKGFFTGMHLLLTSLITIDAYADFYKYPIFSFALSQPLTGREYAIRTIYSQFRSSKLYLQYSYEEKQIKASSETDAITPWQQKTKQKLRIHFEYHALECLKLQSRIEKSILTKNNTSKGILAYQDIIYKKEESPVAIYLRYAIFDTDDFFSRVYAYENDLLYRFSIPAFYYKGTRFYTMLKYEPNTKLDLWIKYAVTTYSNKTTISQGNSEISSNHKSSLFMQIKYKF